MRALVIGGDSFIGGELVRQLEARGEQVIKTTRKLGREDAVFFDMTYPLIPECDVAFICAAVTKFIDCEDDRNAYRVNVDAPISIATQQAEKGALTVFISSEAVERALHTAYGMQKALAEVGLAGVGNVIIARIGKTTAQNVENVCSRIVALAQVGKPGLYRLCG